MATYDEYMSAARKAHESGNADHARQLVQAAQKAQTAAADRPSALYENIVGFGDVDTPGERLGATIQDVAKAGAAGLSRGVTGLMDIPGKAVTAAHGGLTSLLERGAEAVGIDAPEFFEATRQSVAGSPMGVGVGETAAAATGGATEFRGETTPGQFAGTVGEFVPGAVAFGGASPANIAKFGILPGMASEAAGQATEGTALEPYARTAAAMVAPMAASALTKPKTFTAALPGADPVTAKQATYLAQQGVQPTAGQATAISRLQAAEGMLSPTGQQLDDFTAAALRTVGVTGNRATPETLKAAERAIVTSMDDAVRGVSVAPSTRYAQAASRIADDYVARVPAGQVTPRIRGIADEITDFATRPVSKSIPLETLKTWRTDIGKYSASPDGATREAAHSLRNLLDSMTDLALTQAGRADDIAALASARTQYRNLLAIKDASAKAGKEAASGVITPARLQSAVVRTQGKGQFATGGGTELAPLSRAGVGVLSPAPTVSPGAARSIPALTYGGLGAAGFAAGGVPGTLAALMAPAVGRKALMSGPAQRALADPTKALGDLVTGGAKITPGIFEALERR